MRQTFNDITSNILQRTTSFATPSLSVNSFNRLQNLNEVYFSLFEPTSKVAWPGNVKKYEVCEDTDLCTLGEILDANGDPAIGADGRILATAKSFWIDADSPSASTTAPRCSWEAPATRRRTIPFRPRDT